MFSTTKPLDDDDNMDIEEVKEEENLAEEKISDALKGKSYLLVLDDEGKTMRERERLKKCCLLHLRIPLKY